MAEDGGLMVDPIRARLVGGPEDGADLVLPSRQETIEIRVLTRSTSAADPAGLVEVEIVVYVVASVGHLITTYAYDPTRTRPG